MPATDPRDHLRMAPGQVIVLDTAFDGNLPVAGIGDRPFLRSLERRKVIKGKERVERLYMLIEGWRPAIDVDKEKVEPLRHPHGLEIEPGRVEGGVAVPALPSDTRRGDEPAIEIVGPGV